MNPDNPNFKLVEDGGARIDQPLQYWYQEALRARSEARKYKDALEDLLDFKDDWKLKPAQADIVNVALGSPEPTTTEGEK